MDIDVIQCVAPSQQEEAKRCLNETIPGSKHCYLHNANARSLYLKYKHLCNQVGKYDTTVVFVSTDARLVLKYYSLLHQAYLGRLKHRAYAFVDECFDAGHQYQLDKLHVLLTQTETTLSKIWASQEELGIKHELEMIADDIDGGQEEDNEANVPSTPSHVEILKQSRAQLMKETNELLERYKYKTEGEKYILEEKLFKQIDKLTPAFKSIKKMFDNGCGLGNLVVCITNIVLKADELGCFNEKYIPDERIAKGSTCNNVRPWVLPNKVMTRYCEHYPMYQIKRVYECVLLKWKVIEPMLLSILGHAMNKKTWNVIMDMYKIRWYEGRVVLVLYSYDGQDNNLKSI